MVFASSSSVYGDTPVLPKVETMPLKPQSPYATTKATGELYCQNFTDIYGLPTVALRYFNVFGPRQDPASQYAAVIPKFITAIIRGEPPVIYGDGQQSRDFTYVKMWCKPTFWHVKPRCKGFTMWLVAGEPLSMKWWR